MSVTGSSPPGPSWVTWVVWELWRALVGAVDRNGDRRRRAAEGLALRHPCAAVIGGPLVAGRVRMGYQHPALRIEVVELLRVAALACLAICVAGRIDRREVVGCVQVFGVGLVWQRRVPGRASAVGGVVVG